MFTLAKHALRLLIAIAVLAFGFSYAYNRWIQPDAIGNPQELAAGGNFVSIEDVTYHFKIIGSGTSTYVLFPCEYCSMETYKDLADTLAKKNQVVLFDFPGYGYSDRRKSIDYSLAAESARLAKLFAHLNIKSAQIIGTSYGATVALAFAQDYSDKVQNLTLISPTVLQEKSSLAKLTLSIPQISKAGLKLYFSDKRLESMLKTGFGDPSLVTAEDVKNFIRPFKVAGTEESLITRMKQKESSRYDYKSIGNKPVLLLWGEKDRVVTRQEMEHLRADMYDPKLVTLSGIGHFAQQEAPDLVVNEVQGLGVK